MVNYRKMLMKNENTWTMLIDRGIDEIFSISPALTHRLNFMLFTGCLFLYVFLYLIFITFGS